MPDLDQVVGTWPNVAILAGTDPQEAMEQYGVEPRGLRTAAYDYERRIAGLEVAIRGLWPLARWTMDEADERIWRARLAALGIEVGE